MDLLARRLGPGAAAEFAVAHVDSPDAAAWFKAEIEKHFAPAGEVFTLDASPALALHTGFGTVAVAWIEPASPGDAPPSAAGGRG